MGEKNDLLSAVASDDVVDCVEHLVEYLSCRVFGQAMYKHVTFINEAVQPLQNATIKSQTLGEESTSVFCNWLLKLAQALMPVAYVRLQRRSLIGSGVCRR